MSTTTANLGLIKPELTDAADITATNENWDKIDEKLHNAYSDENKPDIIDLGGLPLDGSEKMTGSLKITDYGEVFADNSYTRLISVKDANNFRCIQVLHPNIYSLESVIQWANVLNGERKNYNLFGAHNKPSGTYTGNGSNTQRTIATGGIGNVCAVWRSGTQVAFVTDGASLCGNPEGISCLGTGQAKFKDGILTLATTHDCFNTNGSLYYYQVL